MKTYLVGGAVRDSLLGLPIKDRDWVVVGARPEEMNQKGFKAVGNDFPVFLHPLTKEEYALARTERKSGRGYGGFTFNTDPSVTLEEDLQRRDLTINAIAQDEQGRIVDPYGGQGDLKSKVLRHVSNAFREDPLRVVRVARFAARYHHLGFHIAEETFQLMRQIVKDNELKFLSAERLWQETVSALGETSPQIFFSSLRETEALVEIFPEIDRLFGVPQPAEHHPEIDTGVHTLLVLEQAAKLSENKDVRFAALVHDLGKSETPKENWPKHIAHEKRTPALIDKMCGRLKIPNEFREIAKLTGQFHTHCHRALELTPKKIVQLFERLDILRRPERLEKFLVACEADARGRTGFENRDYPQAEYLRGAAQVYKNIDFEELAKNFSGKELGEKIRVKRIAAIKIFSSSQKK